MSDKMRIAVFCQEGLTEFVLPIIEELKDHCEVMISFAQAPGECVMMAKWADVVWLEWGNEVAIKLTTARGVLDNKYTILRVHSYEIFMNYLSHIRWDVVDQLICPNQTTMDLVLQAGDLGVNLPRIYQLVMPTGVDLKKFHYKRKFPDGDIAFVARLNHKKGIQLLVQVARQHPGTVIHIAGDWQDTRLKLYFEHITKDLDNIQFDGWVDHSNMPTWLEDKSYILCCSPYESQGLGLMEAMATGIKPLVHDFPGAREMYPEDCIWSDLDQLSEILDEGEYKSHEYRRHIELDFSFTQTMRKVNAILPSNDQIQSAKEGFVPKAKPGDVKGAIKPAGELPRLAVALMYKDEESNLPRCLDSVKDFADVIVAMDTGSTDSSTTILESYGAQVHVPSDLNHLFTMTEHGLKLMFGPARNRLLSFIPDDVGWIFMIDCDEQFIPTGTPAELKAWLGALGPQFNSVAINMTDWDSGKEVMDFNATRMFRRGMVHFKNIVHNEPHCDGPAAMFDQGTMNHFGYDLPPDQREAKHDRTMGLLNRRIKDDPQDWKAYFYKGQALGFYRPDDLDGIIEATRTYVDHKREMADFNLSAYFTLIRALMHKGEAAEAWTFIMEAKESLPDDLDISMAMLEWGVWTKNELIISTSCLEFMRIWELYDKDPTKKGGRFIYSHNTTALVFVTFYQTTSQLRTGAASLEKFRKLADQVPDDDRDKLLQDMDAALAGTGVSLHQASAP